MFKKKSNTQNHFHAIYSNINHNDILNVFPNILPCSCDDYLKKHNNYEIIVDFYKANKEILVKTVIITCKYCHSSQKYNLSSKKIRKKEIYW